MNKHPYYIWLLEQAGIPKDYDEICELLFTMDYFWLMDLDKDRSEDGIALRYRYGDIYGYNSMFDIIDSSCSCLEMIIALAMRKETIMGDDAYGDRTWVWTHAMFDSLGLYPGVDYEEAIRKITRWLNRDFSPDGKGGLFTIPSCNRDLRKIDIWTASNWWFASMDI